MDHLLIANKLEENAKTFDHLLRKKSKSEIIWRSAPEKWNLLDIVSHLLDEEKEDFRARVKHVLETPEFPMPKIDPAGWVTSRNYSDNDFSKTLQSFLEERKRSIEWLRALKSPDWNRTYLHEKMGALPAKMFLINWHAHDLLHMRQIIRIDFEHTQNKFSEKLDYAGNW